MNQTARAGAMIGKWTLKTDKRPHCCNGWGPTPDYPACNYTGGHFCEMLKDHDGECRCACGSTCAVRIDVSEEKPDA